MWIAHFDFPDVGLGGFSVKLHAVEDYDEAIATARAVAEMLPMPKNSYVYVTAEGES